MDDVRLQFWADLQLDLFTKTSVMFLADQDLTSVISTNGNKAHRPIISRPTTGTYSPHTDISFQKLYSGKETLTVDQFPFAAEEIDATEKNQTQYDLLAQATNAIRDGLILRVEQIYLSQISNSFNKINGGTAFEVTPSNIGDVIQQADGLLGAVNVPVDSESRYMVVDPFTVAMLRKARADKETPLGDTVDSTGIVGTWRGWTVVQCNNLPWSGTLTIAVNPTSGDTVTIGSVKFTFVSSIGTTGGNVLIGASASATADNLAAAVNQTSGAGTTYIDFQTSTVVADIFKANQLRSARKVTMVNASGTITVTGYGAITTASSFTSASNLWSAQKQDCIFMMKGAIDLVLQFSEFDFMNKAENRFADKPKAMIGCGTKMFNDGAMSSVYLPVSAKNWGAQTF